MFEKISVNYVPVTLELEIEHRSDGYRWRWAVGNPGPWSRYILSETECVTDAMMVMRDAASAPGRPVLNNQPDRRGSKPTIAELEAILRDGGAQIEVLPNGEVRALNTQPDETSERKVTHGAADNAASSVEPERAPSSPSRRLTPDDDAIGRAGVSGDVDPGPLGAPVQNNQPGGAPLRCSNNIMPGLETEYIAGRWVVPGAEGPEPDAVVAYSAEPSPETGHSGWLWWARGQMGEAVSYRAACAAAEKKLGAPVHSQHSDGGVSEPNTDISRRVGDGRRRNE